MVNLLEHMDLGMLYELNGIVFIDQLYELSTIH